MNRRIVALVIVAACLSFGACARSLSVGPLRAGVAAADDEKWDEAVRFWKEALVQDPGSAAAHNNLAVAFEKQGDWAAAAKEYEEAVRLDPGNASIRGNYESFKARVGAAKKRAR